MAVPIIRDFLANIRGVDDMASKIFTKNPPFSQNKTGSLGFDDFRVHLFQERNISSPLLPFPKRAKGLLSVVSSSMKQLEMNGAHLSEKNANFMRNL